jgi:putative selenate reductase
MSDRFRPLSTKRLAAWIFGELEGNGSILGVPRQLFFSPSPSDRFTTELYGHPLETPIGVAAGPHSQLTANIVAAWLCGARFIELKTVQTLDDIEVPKPCIDMQDAGYNVEWSQELTLEQSLDEYLRAWVLVHVLHRRLGFPGDRPGVVFNLSVGYDLEGIRKPNVERFLRGATDADDRISHHLQTLARFLPEANEMAVPRRLSDNVTLSTMHGCPPDEIAVIARHLMEVWGLHTSVKLNPTLLGPDAVRLILHERLGYREVVVPDSAFAHDPRFDEAVALISDLRTVAGRCDLQFGVKLANTLEVEAHHDVFDCDQRTMYLSGRPLHALVVQLAHRLTEAIDGRVTISFAGGADAFNVAELLASGLRPVTTCSDLLRPPGYLRLPQYLAAITRAMNAVGAVDLDDFAAKRAGDPTSESARFNLARYAERVLDEPTLQKDRFDRSRTKTRRRLGPFDCIQAPCTDECSVDQRVPEYMRLVRAGRMGDAVAVTRDDNPLPGILGRACHHPCEQPCLRTHLDDPLAIRELKRFIMEHEAPPSGPPPPQARGVNVAVVGGGPCGLSTATFLARAGSRPTAPPSGSSIRTCDRSKRWGSRFATARRWAAP